MIYRLPLSALGASGLQDTEFVVSGTLNAHNPKRTRVEAKKWFFDLTPYIGSIPPVIIYEEGENV